MQLEDANLEEGVYPCDDELAGCTCAVALDRATLAGMENFQINLGRRIMALRRRLGLKANDVLTVDLNSLV